MKQIAILLTAIFCISTVSFAAVTVKNEIKGKGQKIEKKVRVVKTTKVKVVKETKGKDLKAKPVTSKSVQPAPEQQKKRNIFQKIWHKLFGRHSKPAEQTK